MNLKINGEEHLVGHYSAIGSLRSDFRNYNLFNLISSFVKGKSVVDIGCGAAFLLGIIKKQGRDVKGIEPSEGMRALAYEVNPDIKVFSGRAEEVDSIIKEPVDSVLMIDVLEHVEKDIEQTRKVFSVLKPGGEFILVVPSHTFLYGERDRQMGHYRRYSKNTIKDTIIKNGFKIEKIRYWNALGFLPYLISEKIFKKPLDTRLRKGIRSGIFGIIMKKLLDNWFRYIENNFNFGFGLSIILIAKKIQ